MKNHRRLKNSKLLRFFALIVLAVLFVPLVLSATTAHGATGLLCAGLPMMGVMRMEEVKDPANPDSPGIGAALAAIEDKTLPMSQRLDVAFKALKGIDPTNQLATIKADFDAATKSLTAKDDEITKLKADLDTAQKQIGALQTDVADHDKARAAAEKTAADLTSKEQDITKRADSLAKEKMKSLGFNSSELPPQNPQHESKEQQENGKPEAKIRRLQGKDRVMAAEHFRTHKKLPDWVDAKLAEIAALN